MINLTRLGDFHADMTVDAHILKRSTAYAVDDKVNKGLIYLKCTQAGITASTALSLSGVSVGDTLTDGSVIWKVLSIKGVPEGGGTGAGLEDWESNHDYAVDDIYVYEGEIYKTLIAFTSGATEDSRTKVNNIVPSVWAANTAYTAGDIIEHTDVTTLKKVYYNVTDDFTSGATFEVTAEMQELQIVEEYVPNPLTKQQVKNLINNFVPSGSGTDPIFYNDSPIGTIIAYMGITAPKDYLACDGQTYNIVDYKELAEYIKVQFGRYDYFGGDGTTTFAVPDLRGEFLRGTGTNSHTNQGSGSSVGTHQDGTILTSMASYNNYIYKIRGSSSPNFYVANTDSVVEFRNDALVVTGNVEAESSLQPATYTTRPTNTSVLYCIKYTTSVLSTPENSYSTEEQRIGTWIDGKPLYQITYSLISPSTENTAEELADIPANSTVETIFSLRAIMPGTLPNVGVYVSNFYATSSENMLVWIRPTGKITCHVNGSFLLSRPLYITLKYTKTTD